MEVSYLLLYLGSVVLILVTGICLLIKGRWSSDGEKNLPPGSLGWPVIGETMEFLSGKPEKFVFDRMNKYSPRIFKTKILGHETAVICGPEGHKFLFSNEQKLFTAFRPLSMQKLFRSHQAAAAAAPSKIRREAEVLVLRSPVFLRPEALVRYLGTIDLVTQQQLETYWEGKDEVKVFPLAKTLTLTLASRFFLGTEDPGPIARLVSSFDDITSGMHSVPVNIPGTKFYKASKAAAAIRKALRSVIGEKKAAITRGEPILDIFSHMIIAADEDGRHKPEAEIVNNVMGLVVAGYNTVATAMTFFMKYVGEEPDIYDKVLAEQLGVTASKKPGELLDWEDMQKMKYSSNVLNEVMRLAPPLQGTFREALRDFTYAGYTIPKGWKVYWTVSTTNKNSKYFPDPEKFDPSRYENLGTSFPPFTFVPFGGGPRTCPGKEYARLVMLSFVHNVVKRFKWEMMLPEERIIGDMMPIPEKGLPIRLQHH